MVVGEIGADEYGRLISSIRLDLLDLFGKEYVIQHVIQTWQQEQKELLYRVYVTDCLQSIGENVARLNDGKYLPQRWIGLLHPAPQETRTKEEIISHIREKIAAL